MSGGRGGAERGEVCRDENGAEGKQFDVECVFAKSDTTWVGTGGKGGGGKGPHPVGMKQRVR